MISCLEPWVCLPHWDARLPWPALLGPLSTFPEHLIPLLTTREILWATTFSSQTYQTFSPLFGELHSSLMPGKFLLTLSLIHASFWCWFWVQCWCYTSISKEITESVIAALLWVWVQIPRCSVHRGPDWSKISVLQKLSQICHSRKDFCWFSETSAQAQPGLWGSLLLTLPCRLCLHWSFIVNFPVASWTSSP